MFERISIGIRTFLRDEKLLRCVDSILRTMPDAHLIIADDGEPSDTKSIYYEGLEALGHKVLCLPFDSGFGRKSNAIIDNLERDFLLVGSDDFDFSAPDVAVGISKMLATLDKSPIPHMKFDIASGRLRNRGEYEFDLTERDGIITERSCKFDKIKPIISAVQCDITFNYSLIRRSVFWTEGFDTNENGTGWVEKRTNIGFDDEEIIGEGGHGAFFLDCKRVGLKVAYVPGVFIDEMPEPDSLKYKQYRYRACGPSRKCFEKRGLKRYVLGNGIVDYERKENGMD